MSRIAPPSVVDTGFAELLDAVRGIRWLANTRLRSGNPGAHASRLRGASAEFMEYRPYRQGDYPGRIDWKLFARSNRAYIRLSNDHAVLPTVFLLDASASMAFPVPSHSKWKLASATVVGLASVARNGGDPVGLMVPSQEEGVAIRPGTRQSVMSEIIRAITDKTPGSSASLAPALSTLARSAARIVVLSDFLGDTEHLIAAAARCTISGCEVHAVHIVAKGELSPIRGLRLVRDPEDDSVRRPLTDDALHAYVAKFTEWRDTVARDLANIGVYYSLAIAGDESAEHLVRRISAPRTLSVL